MKRAQLQRSTPLRQVSVRRQRGKGDRDRVREAVFARDGDCLLRGSGRLGECWGGLTFGHLQKASAGGPYTEANGIALCEFHNDECENRPATAVLLGLVVRAGESHADAERRRRRHGLIPWSER